MNDTNKQVILRFGHGSFEQGFDVNLRITTEEKTLADQDGFLPKNLELLQSYHRLLRSYQEQFIWNYNGYYRGFRALEIIPTETTHISVRDAADELMAKFNFLLDQSKDFKSIREELLHHLNPNDSIRFVIRTFDPILQWLPWHLCNLFQLYAHSGVTLSLPPKSHQLTLQNRKSKVRVLPILGDSTNIDIQADLIVLRDKLPESAEILDAQIATSLAAIGDALWEQNPDILFFAGHSSSRGEQGVFYINEHDQVAIEDLKFALKKAIDKGLKLAIFNSCDGIKLAQDLADLNLPAIIVMRERIPDESAQKFLEFFLEAFANPDQPKPLTQAVREAQERLQHYEHQFPCLSWLPVLFQQSEAVDLTWQDLRLRDPAVAPNSPNFEARKIVPKSIHSPRLKLTHQAIIIVLLGLLSLLSTSLLVKSGQLAPLELAMYDWMTRLTNPNIVERDPRILVVTIDESDIEYQDEQGMERLGTLADEALLQAVEQLEPVAPSTLGLHIYRPYDFRSHMTHQLAQDDRFYLTCKHNPNYSEPNITAAKEGLPVEKLGFDNTIIDSEGFIIRRIYIAAFPPESEQYCQTFYSFSTALTLHHLKHVHDLEVELEDDGQWTINNVTLNTVKRDGGAYLDLPNEGDQLLLRYQYDGNFENGFYTISLQELLENGIPQWLTEVLQHPIVIIGNTAHDYNNKEFFTPFGKPISGTFLSVQSISYLLGITLDDKPQMRWLSTKSEYLWLLFWSVTSAILALRTAQSPRYWWGAFGMIAGLGCSVLYLFSQFWWFPFTPSLGAIWISYVSVKLWLRYVAAANVEQKVFLERPH